VQPADLGGVARDSEFPDRLEHPIRAGSDQLEQPPPALRAELAEHPRRTDP
jgi:hypothetical protein